MSAENDEYEDFAIVVTANYNFLETEVLASRYKESGGRGWVEIYGIGRTIFGVNTLANKKTGRLVARTNYGRPDDNNRYGTVTFTGAHGPFNEPDFVCILDTATDESLTPDAVSAIHLAVEAFNAAHGYSSE